MTTPEARSLEARSLEALEAIKKLSQELEEAKQGVLTVIGKIRDLNAEYGSSVTEYIHELKRKHSPHDLVPMGAEKPIHVGDVSLPWLRPVNCASGEISFHAGHLYHLEPGAVLLD